MVILRSSHTPTPLGLVPFGVLIPLFPMSPLRLTLWFGSSLNYVQSCHSLSFFHDGHPCGALWVVVQLATCFTLVSLFTDEYFLYLFVFVLGPAPSLRCLCFDLVRVFFVMVVSLVTRFTSRCFLLFLGRSSHGTLRFSGCPHVSRLFDWVLG